MNSFRCAIALCILSVCLVGCKKSGTTAADTGMNGNQNPVATAPAAMPPSDAAIPPRPPIGVASGSTGGTGQSSPDSLTKTQEATSMPLPGQANDHSQLGKEEAKK